MATNFCVISHTHWDREWYVPFERFRIRLVDMMDGLLAILDGNERYRFHLDAQTVILEDYLEIRPERRADLERYIGQGRILVGPWYIQNDLFLSSGEATIRNLMTGWRIASNFGRCTMVGYTPDQFGLISQLPQILRRFGIDSCLFARGYTPEQSAGPEFYWRSDDGSEVLAVFLPFWYNNAQRFSADPQRALGLVEYNRQRLQAVTGLDSLLLMNGVDHLKAQDDLLEILDRVSARLDGDAIFQDTMPEYMDRIRPSVSSEAVVTGEMRGGTKRNLLAGTLSSRVYLKQYNSRCQNLMENLLEPLYSMLDILGVAPYPRGFFRHMWKILIKNHAHDSICGCSTDAVHSHMMDRFRRFEEIGRDLMERGGEALSACVGREGMEDDYLVTVVNTLPQPRSGVVEMDMDFPREEGMEDFCLVDEDGRPADCAVLARRETVRAAATPLNLPGYLDVTRFRVRMAAGDVPAMGYRVWTVKRVVSPAGGPTVPAGAGLPVLENRWLRAAVRPDGAVDLLDKRSGAEYEGLLRLEDREDLGDSYVYESGGHPPVLSSPEAVSVDAHVRNDVFSCCTFSYVLPLPGEYHFGEGSRSGTLVPMPVSVTLTLNADESMLHVEMEVENRARDHCLRVLIPTGIDSGETTASSPFDVIRRKRTDPGVRQPNCGFIGIDDDRRGMAVFNEGLYEYEHTRDALALTLLRCNGYIHNDEQDGDLGDQWRAPGNQCPGRHRFRLALRPYGGEGQRPDIPAMAKAYATPLMGFFQPADRRRFAVARPFLEDVSLQETYHEDEEKHGPVLERKRSLLRMEGKGVLSCLKKAEDRESHLLRFYNPGSEPHSYRLELGWDCGRVYRADLNENRLQSLTLESRSNACDVQAGPKEILTLEIE